MKINDAEKAVVNEVLEILNGAASKLDDAVNNKSIAIIAKLIHAAVMAAEILL